MITVIVILIRLHCGPLWSHLSVIPPRLQPLPTCAAKALSFPASRSRDCTMGVTKRLVRVEKYTPRAQLQEHQCKNQSLQVSPQVEQLFYSIFFGSQATLDVVLTPNLQSKKTRLREIKSLALLMMETGVELRLMPDLESGRPQVSGVAAPTGSW